MKRKHFKLGLLLAAMFLLVFEVCFGGGVSTADGILIATATPGVIAGEAVSTEGTKTASPDLLVNAVEKKITEMAPDRAPLTTLLSHIPDIQTKSALRVDYYTVDYRGSRDVINAEFDATSNPDHFDFTVDNLQMWSTGDTCMLKGVTAYKPSDNSTITGRDLIGYVYSVDTENSKLKVQPLNGKIVGDVPVFADTIAAGTEIVRLAPGGSEKDIVMDPYVDMPEKDYNLMQKFITTIEETHWSKIVDKEVDWGWSDYSRRQLTNMKMEMEKAFLFGHRFEFREKKGNKLIQLMGGAADFITGRDTTLKTLTGDVDNKVYSTLCKNIFSGNGGSSQRLVLVGDSYLAQLGESAPIQKQLAAKNTEVKFGVTYQKINSNYGELLLLRAPIFNEVGLSHMALSLDMNNLALRNMEATRVKDIDYGKQGVSDSQARSVIQTKTLLFKYLDTHKWLEGKQV